MGWDCRRGEKIPTVVRTTFEALEQFEEVYFKLIKGMMEMRCEKYGMELADATIRTTLNNLESEGFLYSRNGGRRGKAKIYTVTEKGAEWWDEHQIEEWGYGDLWLDGLPNIWDDLQNSERGRISITGTELEVWRQVFVLGKRGKIRAVIFSETKKRGSNKGT